MLDVNMQKYASTLLTVVCFIGSVLSKSVRVTELLVPSEAILGDSVHLICRYDLGNEELYVVKWYKDDLEFYRYEPKDQNQSVYFPQPGIDIDLAQSGSNVVVLRNVALDSAGTYKCQVSTDAPTYSCVQAVKEMDIIIMPTSGPVITGGEDGYDFGDNVTLNCTSSKSKPAPMLKWFINGKHVTDPKIIDHGISVDNNNLQVTSKSLQLHIRENMFLNGKLTINCEENFYGKIAVSGKEFTLASYGKSSICRSQLAAIMLPIFLILWSISR